MTFKISWTFFINHLVLVISYSHIIYNVMLRSYFSDKYNVGWAASITSYDVKHITYPSIQYIVWQQPDRQAGISSYNFIGSSNELSWSETQTGQWRLMKLLKTCFLWIPNLITPIWFKSTEPSLTAHSYWASQKLSTIFTTEEIKMDHESVRSNK